MLLPLHALPSGQSGQIELMILEGTDIRTMSGLGVEVGSIIDSVENEYSIGGKSVLFSPEIASQILVRTL